MASISAARRGAAPVVRRQDFEREVLQSEQPVLVELHARGHEYPHFTRAIQEILQEDRENLKFVRIEVEEYQDLLDTYRRNKGYHAYNLDKYPAAALFRKGELVTTFNPTFTSQEPHVQYLDVRRQFRRFLDKFIHYDPEKLTFNHRQ